MTRRFNPDFSRISVAREFLHLGGSGTRRLGGPKGRSIIALGNAQGIESALAKTSSEGAARSTLNPTRGPCEHSRWHALSGLQWYEK